MCWIDMTDIRKETILHRLKRKHRMRHTSSKPDPKLMALTLLYRVGNDLINFDGDQSQTSGGPKSDAVALEELFGGMSPAVTPNVAQPPRQAISLGSPSPAPQTPSPSFPFTNPITSAQSQALWNNNALMSGSGAMQPTPPSASPAFGTPVSVGAGNIRLPLASSSPAVQPTGPPAPTKTDPFADLEGLF